MDVYDVSIDYEIPSAGHHDGISRRYIGNTPCYIRDPNILAALSQYPDKMLILIYILSSF